MIHIGIDPGANGAIAIVDGTIPPLCHQFRDSNIHETARFLSDYRAALCCIEEVSAGGPAAGVQSARSMFAFGCQYGEIRGILAALEITFRKAKPTAWQAHFNLIRQRKKETKTEKKNRHKALAQEIFPSIIVTHATADALLLAKYSEHLHRK